MSFEQKTWVLEKKPLGPPADAKKATPIGKGLNDLEERIAAGLDSVATPASEAVASKGTVTLSASFPDLVEVSGTTTITKIAATSKGHRVTLLFAEALTVKNGENLKLGADFAAVAGSTLTLICDGSAWYPA